MDDQFRYISEPEYATILQTPEPSEYSPVRVFLFCVGLLIGMWVLLYFFLGAPRTFPEESVFIIENGATLGTVALSLKENNMIRSTLIFKVSVRFLGGDTHLKAGDYYFSQKENVISLARRFSHGSYELQSFRVTIPEGFNRQEIAALFDPQRFPRFNQQRFLELTKSSEGYLFPDTYFFMPNTTEDTVIKMMKETYAKRIASIAQEIELFGRPIEDIIIMASIIEEEARTEISRKLIAGILWKRLDEGIPLQVDAAFALVNGKKASSDLTLDDLKIDSPYNTYVYKGLPPGPLSNPGLDSIRATINPTPSKYYFYLSDKQGEMRYGITHDEHVANKNKYLR